MNIISDIIETPKRVRDSLKPYSYKDLNLHSGSDIINPYPLNALKKPNYGNVLSSDAILSELHRCSQDPHYFIMNYVYILDDRTRKWVLFKLYPAQQYALDVLWKEQYSILLKTRQAGASTLVSAYYLWLMLFEENTFCLMLSRGEREAKSLLSDRFKPMYYRLPIWMKPTGLPTESLSEVKFSTGAAIMSLPTSGGDSYTARAAVIDEGALVHRSRTMLSQVLLNVSPTIDAGGQLSIVSKSDKSRPVSTFNSLWVAAVHKKNQYFPVFIPWYGVPKRDDAWHQKQVDLSMSIDGTLDSLHESYPGDWEEAIQAKTLDKRFSPDIINRAYKDAYTKDILELDSCPDIPNLKIFSPYDKDSIYILTCDPAEGNPQSDPSVCHVYDWQTGEQMAIFGGRFEISLFTSYAAQLSIYYGKAGIFIERNNHGHSMINLLLTGLYGNVRVLPGPDSTKNVRKYGYLTTLKSKAIGYVELANLMRDMDIEIHSKETKTQLTALEGSTLKAPRGAHDDHAICAMLFAAAKKFVRIDVVIGFV